MATKPLPSPEQLRQLLRYEPETGKLFWRERTAEHYRETKRPESNAQTFNSYFAGMEAFCSIDDHGYQQGWVAGIKARKHRIIWKLVTGVEPEVIDHLNGDSLDNRFCNLRSTSIAENSRNTKIDHRNTSGCKGVSWVKGRGKWRADIFFDGKHTGLGQFDKIEDAILARKAAEREFGFHPNHGRKQIKT